MSALTSQIGGSHYKDCKIQAAQYIEANNLKFLEGCVVKRVTRHDKPTGKGRQDIEKAIHELQLLLELRYGPEPEVKVHKGYTKCPHCKEVTRAVPGCLSNVCDQCQRVFGFGGAFSEERMDVIGQNGNDGEHYEKPWIAYQSGDALPGPFTMVYYRMRSGKEPDKPEPIANLRWAYGQTPQSYDIVAYRLA